MKIKDRFRGLNLIDDPTELLPGESVICDNLYIKGKSLIQRDKEIQFVASPTTPNNIIAIYLAENINPQHPLLFYFDTDKKMRAYSWSDGQWVGTVISGISFDIDLSGLTDNIRFLEWEDKLIVFSLGGNRIYIFSYINSVPTWTEVNITQFVNCTTTITETQIGPYPPIVGAKYIFEYENSTYGFTGYPYFTDGTVIHEISGLTDGSYSISITMDSFTVPPFSQGYDRVNLYRKRLFADGTEDDHYYFIKSTPIIDGQMSINFVDPVTEPETLITFDLTRVNESGQVIDLPQDITAAEWYNSRVVWATKDGTISFSYENNPFQVPGGVKGNIVSRNSGYAITNLLNFYGTLIIFTEKGIYHCVGLVGNTQADSTYQIYTADPDIRCYPVPNMVVLDSYIFFIAEKGLYRYDTRIPVDVSRNIRPLWIGFPPNKIAKTTLAVDKEKGLILICIPEETVLVYHYDIDLRAEPGEKTVGEWSTWDLLDTVYIHQANRISSSEANEDRDRQSLIPVFAAATKLYYLSGVGNVDSQWKSGEIGGDSLSIKRWLQIKSRIDGTFTLKANDTTIYTNSVDGRYVDRGRIKQRSQTLILEVTSTGQVKLVDFDITAERIGT